MRTPTRTALLYLMIALAWIVVSDSLVIALGLDGNVAQLVKGIGFVFVTAGVLWITLERRERVRERIEVALETSERQYRELFVFNPQPMWVYDLEDLKFLAVNDAAVEKYGYSRDEFLGMTAEDIRPPEDVDAFRESIATLGEGVYHAGVWRHVTKDGELLQAEITSHVTDFDGHRARFVLAEDITMRLAAEEAVVLAKRQLEAVIETSPLAIIQLDREGMVQGWNEAASRMFGWNEAEVIGKPNPIVPDQENYAGRFARVLEGERFDGDRVRRWTKDGAPLDLMLYMAPLMSPTGDIEGAVGLMADITEQVEAEAELKRYRERLEELVQERTSELNKVNEHLRRATQVKSEFLANMSHELRTPLNSIIGFSGAMLQGLAGDLTEEQLKQLGMVYRSGKHLLEIINDVLDLSKIEAGRMGVEVQAFDVNELAESVLETLRPLAERKSLEMRFVPAPGTPEAETDRTKVRQVLLNLVGNAIKFTDTGTVEIRVIGQGSMLLIEVEDTGPGIPAEERALIFDEFTQSNRGADEKPQGTGLGLAISRRLARMMGGELLIDSEIGRGSTFSLRVPRVYVGSRGPATSAIEAQGETGRG